MLYDYVSELCLMRLSHWSAPISPGTGDITFFGAAPVFLSLLLPCPVQINHFSPFIFECPALFSLHFRVPRPFLSHTFSSDFGAYTYKYRQAIQSRSSKRLAVILTINFDFKIFIWVLKWSISIPP